MSVEYKAAPRNEPGIPGGGEIKYGASIVRGKKVGLRSFLEEIDELNIVHAGSILAVLEAFLSKVNYHLINGRAVDLGQLGSFYPSISSSTVDTPEEVRLDTIRKFRVTFRPSALLKERLSKVKFYKEADAIQKPTP